MKDNIILAKGVKRPIDSKKTGLNANVAILGASGSGKTMSFVEPRLLETFDSSLIVTVTKRRIVDKYKPLFAERGYQVWDLNFADPEASDVAFDPLHYVKTSQDCSFLANSIIYANPQKKASINTDHFFDEAATNLLSAEISGIRSTVKSPSFADVIEFHSMLKIDENDGVIKTSFDNFFDKLEKKKTDSFAVSCWKTFRNLPIRTAGCVYSSMNTVVSQVFTPELTKMFRKRNKLNFHELATKKTVLFVTTSPVNTALHTVTNLFYATMFKQLFELAQTLPEGKLPIPVNVIADDFACGGKIPNFDEYISVFREAGISAMLLLQSESQLNSIYGVDQATIILDNCDTIAFVGSMDLKTCQTISQRVNLPLEDVLYMPLQQVMVFRRGERPIIAERYDILNDRRYQTITKQYMSQVKRDTRTI